jgi:hypothetical protein
MRCFATPGSSFVGHLDDKHKKNEIARIIRLNVNLATMGFSQIYGIDYLDTYVLFIKLASIRILLAAIYGLEIHQMDVSWQETWKRKSTRNN